MSRGGAANLKKPYFCQALYIDPKGLHWISLGSGRKGFRAVAPKENLFSQISAADFTGQNKTINPIQAAQGPSQIVDWLREPRAKQSLAMMLQKDPPANKRLGFCLSEAFVVSRFFVMPRIDPVYWRKAIPIEARRYMPFDLQDCLYDWKVIDVITKEGPRLGVFFAAVRQEIFEAARDLVEGLGFELLFVDTLPFALSRAVNAVMTAAQPSLVWSRETALVIYCDGEQVQLLLLHKSLPVLSRSIYLTASAGRGTFSVERRKLNLKASIDFVLRQLDIDDIKKIVLFGADGLDEENLKNWASGVGEELGVKVELIKPMRTLIEGDRPGNFYTPKRWSELAVLGVGLRGLDNLIEAEELDLSSSVFAIPPKEIALKKIWRAAVVVSALFLLAGFGSWISARTALRGLTKIQAASNRSFKELEGQGVAAIKAMADMKNAELRQVSAWINPKARTYLTPILVVLVQSVPDAAWVESWDYRQVDKGSAGKEIVLRLNLIGKLEAEKKEEETLRIQEFYRRLKESQALASYFKHSDLAFQKQESAVYRASGLADGPSSPLLNFKMDFVSNAKD